MERNQLFPVAAGARQCPLFPCQIAQEQKGFVAVAAEKGLADDLFEPLFIAQLAGIFEPAPRLGIDSGTVQLQPFRRHTGDENIGKSLDVDEPPRLNRHQPLAVLIGNLPKQFDRIAPLPGRQVVAGRPQHLGRHRVGIEEHRRRGLQRRFALGAGPSVQAANNETASAHKSEF